MLPLERSGLGSEECRGRLKDFELAEDNKLRGPGTRDVGLLRIEPAGEDLVVEVAAESQVRSWRQVSRTGTDVMTSAAFIFTAKHRRR